MKTIGIIDSHPVLRKGMRYLLTTLLIEVEILEARSINDFYETYPNIKPDLIILAIGQNPPVTNKMYLVHKALNWYQDVKIIVYDEETDPHMVSRYLNSGIHGYVSKQGKITELVACIMDVMDGYHYARV